MVADIEETKQLLQKKKKSISNNFKVRSIFYFFNSEIE